MKIKDGFISNSSSASFVIRWRCHSNYDPMNVGYAACLLLDAMYLYDVDTDKVREDPERHYEDVQNVVKWIVDNTKVVKDNVFETSDYTTMMNSVMDFASEVRTMAFALMNDTRNFEVLYNNIESD